jgi:hypothetical protein
MSKDKFSEVEKLMRNVFKNAAISADGEGLTGIYYPLAALPKEVERQLTRCLSYQKLRTKSFL